MAQMNAGRLITNLAAETKPAQPYDCGIHDITYKAYKPGCPLCSSEREKQQIQAAAKEMRGKLELLHQENQKLKLQVDISYAIREAAELLDDDDMAFFKAVLYEWRDTKSVALKVTHGGAKTSTSRSKRKPIPPNGFIVMPRQGDPYGHVCSSMGGLAIAEYFVEAQNSVGPAKAMELLVRGMSPYLPGAIT